MKASFITMSASAFSNWVVPWRNKRQTGIKLLDAQAIGCRVEDLLQKHFCPDVFSYAFVPFFSQTFLSQDEETNYTACRKMEQDLQDLHRAIPYLDTRMREIDIHQHKIMKDILKSMKERKRLTFKQLFRLDLLIRDAFKEAFWDGNSGHMDVQSDRFQYAPKFLTPNEWCIHKFIHQAMNYVLPEDRYPSWSPLLTHKLWFVPKMRLEKDPGLVIPLVGQYKIQDRSFVPDEQGQFNMKYKEKTNERFVLCLISSLHVRIEKDGFNFEIVKNDYKKDGIRNAPIYEHVRKGIIGIFKTEERKKQQLQLKKLQSCVRRLLAMQNNSLPSSSNKRQKV